MYQFVPGQTGRTHEIIDPENLEKTFKNSPVMSRLLVALEKGVDIGDYGRLVFVLVARHFVGERQMVELLERQPAIGRTEAQAVVREVKEHDYSPPTCQQIQEWQSYQKFQMCTKKNGEGCDIYQDLTFPRSVTERSKRMEQERVTTH